MPVPSSVTLQKLPEQLWGEQGRNSPSSSEVLRGASWAAWGLGEECEEFRMSHRTLVVAGTAIGIL